MTRLALFGIFSDIRKVAEALLRCRTVLSRIGDLLEEYNSKLGEEGPLAEDVQSLKLGMALWEAEMEAEKSKANTSYKAARASEERARTMKRSYGSSEGDLEGEDEMREAYEKLGLLPQGDAEAGDLEEVPGVHPVVESEPRSSRALVRAYKFGA